MTFSEQLTETTFRFREQPRVFHVLATRYWRGVESLDELQSRTQVRPVTSRHVMSPELSNRQLDLIIGIYQSQKQD